jgi:Fur family ferric uptake transcriptional regulator
MQMKIVCKYRDCNAGDRLQSSRVMGAPSKAMDYEAMLRDAGLRITKPRRVILEILGQSEGHPDAAQIFERAVARDSRISLATVYRTMKALEEYGAIQRHAFAGGPARFEPAQAGHHDHLIDLDTGAVIEFTSARIEALQEEIAARLGYEIVHHRLELYGRKIKTD